ncbi:hypothetical protein [Helicobacter bilis]|uniref:hypothetical protein n=1 Tax=Helicobacter bilis TaxID=37372 RepID=UPI0025A94066|nr:hypothetical protein [Helicobacter bilis]
MCRKKFYVKSLEKVIYANVSFRYNKVVYETNENESVTCSLNDFVLTLGAIEINENINTTEQIIKQHFLLTEQAKAKKSKELLEKQKEEYKRIKNCEI